MAQAPLQMVSTKDFNAFFDLAVAQATAIADIARAHGLSDDEENQVRRAIGTLQQYTVPMVSAPAPVAAQPSCPVFPEAPAPAGIPWWAAAAAGIGIGAAAVGLLA
jgi:hypothetical protein